MKRNDPYTRIQRQQLSSLSITLPALVLLVIFEVVNPYNAPVVKVIFLVPFALALILGLLAIIRIRTDFKQLELRRERALRGDRSLLAREQPLADPNALPLPTTIRLDQSRRVVVFVGIVIALVIFISFVVGIVIGTSHYRSGNDALLLIFLIVLGAAAVALLFALVLIFFLLRRQLIFTIVVDEQSISSTYQGITSSIRWSDVRLFAVLNPEKFATMRFYELSNAQTVVRWVDMPTRTVVQRKNNRANLEYHRNVEALLSFVAGRTGLLLYDLSPSTGVMVWRRN